MNKRILISGASRGLGLCFAKKYLEDGCMVFAGARNEGAAGLKELKEKYGDLLVPLQLDVADTKSVESAAEAACAYTDQDVYKRQVANNVSEYDYDKLFGTYHTSQQMAAFLLELYDSDKVVGSVDRENFTFKLNEPLFAYAGHSKHNQKL